MATTKITTPELFDFSATNTALQLPTGTTLERPTNASAGEWRFNTDEKYVEYYDGTTPYDASKWFKIDTEELPNPADFPSQNFNVNTYFGNGASQTIDAKFNEAANFNGSSSLITLPDSSVISQQNNFTISFWVKPNGFVSFGTVLTLYSDYRNYVDIRTNGILGFDATGSQVDTPSSSITDGVWQHIAITKSSTAGTVIYVNGTAVVTDASDTGNATDFTSNSYPNTIGAYKLTGSASDFFPGSIDQVRIFNTVLPATGTASIATLYAETTTTAATLDFPVGAGCTAAYQLDGDASDISGTYGGATTDIGYTGLKFQPDFVWMKSRQATATQILIDSVRGAYKQLASNGTDQQYDINPYGLSSFNSNGFTVADVTNGGYGVNGAPGQTYTGTNAEYVGWAFKGGGAPTATNSAGAGNVPTAGSVKIDGSDLGTALAGDIAANKISANTKNGFSIVKYAGNNTANQTISHGLNASPTLIITKCLNDGTKWWGVNNTSLTANNLLRLDSTSGEIADSGNYITMGNSSTFTVQDGSIVNGSLDYIAYCFHSVAGYQRVGSYTGDGNASGNYIYTTSDGTATGTDGFEPAFLLLKNTDTGGTSWLMYDNKRTPANPRETALIANSGGGDVTSSSFKINFFTNGFEVTGNGSDINGSGDTFIYLAIAADKDTSVPTQANSFSPTIYTGNGGTQNIYTPFTPDLTWTKCRTGAVESHVWNDTIRGISNTIYSNTQGGQYFGSGYYVTSFNPNGYTQSDNAAGNYGVNGNGINYVSWNWKAGGLPTINNDGSTTSIVSVNQASGFSIVRYRGNSAANQTVGHGLGTGNIPKLMIIKKFSGTSDWVVYSADLTDATYVLNLNNANSENNNNNPFNGTAPTDTVFTVEQNAGNVNDNGQDFIAYCFADITNYQKAGTYAGNLTTPPSITTGFSPRFLMIKKIDNGTGPWVVIDSARAPTNPASARLRANASDLEYSDSAEGIYRSATGFTVGTVGNLNTWDGMNANSTNYLYLAIA